MLIQSCLVCARQTGYRTRSIMSVPMLDPNNKIIGVLQVLNKNPAYPRFDREDETLLKTFSAQVPAVLWAACAGARMPDAFQ